ncbi:unnamed protein product [Clonostachys solani]|uniref:Uncharacterized protein n=1 Tax=Clonostachys solani TaxID=160281 RepID=A0A9N9W608_9HYPO|nr:unnamed protein product [Clonostachys solani]
MSYQYDGPSQMQDAYMRDDRGPPPDGACCWNYYEFGTHRNCHRAYTQNKPMYAARQQPNRQDDNNQDNDGGGCSC